MSRVRATGLTFAPEAGTQRMRDVVNKNVTEEDITRVGRERLLARLVAMKLYFMIGLPTETDEDVVGIAQTGGRLQAARAASIRKDADVTVSVSARTCPSRTRRSSGARWTRSTRSQRKQRMLRDIARAASASTLKYHDAGISSRRGHLRARRSPARRRASRRVWRDGARFDGWDEQFDARALERGARRARRRCASATSARAPVDARLPWDHIDVGLEDGFLAWEYRKALKNRVSPPCGKPTGTLLHHTNIEDAEADQRKLVCYDCGVACDLTQMRDERLVYLRKLDAHKPTVAGRAAARCPCATAVSVRGAQPEAPDGAFAQADGHALAHSLRASSGAARSSRTSTRCACSSACSGARGSRSIYSKGFHPKPQLIFAPALGLGVAALGEICDVRIDFDGDGDDAPGAAARGGARGARRARGGEARRRRSGDLEAARSRPIGRRGCRRRRRTLRTEELAVKRLQKRVRKTIDVARHLDGARLVDGDEAASLRAALEWPDGGVIVGFRLRIEPKGGAKPSEVIEALTGGEPPEGTRFARTAMWALRDVGLVEPMDAATGYAQRQWPRTPAAPGAVVAGDPDGAAVAGADGVLGVATADAGRRQLAPARSRATYASRPPSRRETTHAPRWFPRVACRRYCTTRSCARRGAGSSAKARFQAAKCRRADAPRARGGRPPCRPAPARTRPTPSAPTSGAPRARRAAPGAAARACPRPRGCRRRARRRAACCAWRRTARRRARAG